MHIRILLLSLRTNPPPRGMLFTFFVCCFREYPASATTHNLQDTHIWKNTLRRKLISHTIRYSLRVMVFRLLFPLSLRLHHQSKIRCILRDRAFAARIYNDACSKNMPFYSKISRVFSVTELSLQEFTMTHVPKTCPFIVNSAEHSPWQSFFSARIYNDVCSKKHALL